MLYKIVRPILFNLEAEVAHELSLFFLKIATSFSFKKKITNKISDPKKIMGLSFENPVGLAAGLDKNGEYIDSLASLGFGFLELGTVTPLSQKGNSKPRVFRLPKDNAIINRLGFNNKGVKNLVLNIQSSKFFQNREGILGVNIGKNADTPFEKAEEDYVFCLRKIYPFADYITINISSPNTKNLRQLQNSLRLNNFLMILKNEQKILSDKFKKYVPLALKLSPDLDNEEIKMIAKVVIKNKIDSIIVSNTTIKREMIYKNFYSNQVGGLSGEPLFKISNNVIKKFFNELGNEIPIIGVGGIMNGNDAKLKINCGASLVQIYTGLIYKGPSIVRECILDLEKK